MTDLPPDFAAALRWLRAFTTQREFASRCGLSSRSIAAYEAGALPSLRALRAVLDALPTRYHRDLKERWQSERAALRDARKAARAVRS